MMKAVWAKAALGTMLLAGTAHAAEPAAGPRFARIFTDHAVLQRDRPVALWGWAAPRQQVTVALGDHTLKVRTDRGGRWQARFPAMPAGGPYQASIVTAAGKAQLDDLLIGDVYLCSGQSNMEFQLRYATGALSGFGAAANAQLRFVTIDKTSAPAPLADLKTPVAWKVAAPDSVGDASAVCYFMAKSLQESQKVPVGFIASSWGGTTIQSWISPAALRTVKAFAPGVAAVDLYATDPKAAIAREDARIEAWWDAYDPNAAAQRAWRAPDFDDTAWPKMSPVTAWKRSGVPALAAFDGVMWLRGTVTLTEAQVRDAERLQLGPVDKYDSSWINGVRVGSGATDWMWRDYPVLPGTLKAGRNSIVLRVLGSGGLTGPADSRGIRLASGTVVPLDPEWRYQTGMKVQDLKSVTIAPSPWEVPTSLTTLYNGMIAPLAGYGLKLAAWYQGESNVGSETEYRTLLPLLMRNWRSDFDAPQLPFLIAQLSTIGTPSAQTGQSSWAAFRAMQGEAAQADPHAALAVTIDVGDRHDIHPTQKLIVGERLARAARVIAYGETGTAPGGPEAMAVTRSGADLKIRFRHVGTGLKAYSAAQAIGFESCIGEQCSFATAIPDGDSVTLVAANRPGVTQVRYAWSDAPYVNLYSSDDLPAVPFALPVP